MAVTPHKTPGSFGAAPAGAPHEVSDERVPGDITFIDREGKRVSAQQLAREYEQDVPAYAPPKMTIEQMASFLGKSVDEVKALQHATAAATTVARPPVIAPPPVIAAPQIILTDLQPTVPLLRVVAKPMPAVAATAVAAEPVAPAAAPVDPPVVAPDIPDAPLIEPPTSLAAAAQALHARPSTTEPYRPAASDSDSPARGQPTAIADQGKQITGGFGDLGEAQYFPLDGREAGLAVIAQLESLIARVKDDLRFSMAVTYPRVRIRSSIDVECFAADHSFQIVKLLPPHEKTPLDVARRHGQEIVFCLVEQLEEMTDDGQSVTPPNATRLGLGLALPRKRAVQTPGGRMLVDVTD